MYRWTNFAAFWNPLYQDAEDSKQNYYEPTFQIIYCKWFTSSNLPNEAHFSTSITSTTQTTTKTPITTITTTTSKPLEDIQVNQFELKSVKVTDTEIPIKIPFDVDETVVDLGIIKYPVPDILKKTKVFNQFQNRKLFLNHACKYSKGIKF